jgi:drug/metabolite transporter (DMT)-like permease
LLKPSIELLFATVLWGFGFIATVWLLPFLSPAAILSYRFIFTFIIGLAILPLLKVLKLQRRDWRQAVREEFKYSAPSGLLLGLCIYLQTWGLEKTSATNSGFITTLYVVFVPFIASIFLKEKLDPLHWVGVFLALLGTGFIVQLRDLQLNFGDLLTLGCSIVAAIQIVYIGWIGNRSHSPLTLNILQCLWAGLPFLSFAPLQHNKWLLSSLDFKAWLGLLALIFGSNLIAFSLQLKAQKEMPASLASLFYLLESPLACLFAIFFLNETLVWSQGLGAFLIFTSCGFALLAEKKRRKIHII